MKATRSTVGKGLNLSTRVEKQRKGRGAYVRKNKNHLFGYEDRYSKHD